MANVAIVQDGFKREDPLSTLKLVTKPIPSPSPGQVVVHVKLRNIHIFDLNTLRGSGVANGTPGCEGYGIVHEVGEGVTKLQKGQRVVPVVCEAMTTGNGAWQEYVCLDEEYVWPLPEGITDEQAAQIVINPWTAYSMLKELQPVPEGEIPSTERGRVDGRQAGDLGGAALGHQAHQRRAPRGAEGGAEGAGRGRGDLLRRGGRGGEGEGDHGREGRVGGVGRRGRRHDADAGGLHARRGPHSGVRRAGRVCVVRERDGPVSECAPLRVDSV